MISLFGSEPVEHQIDHGHVEEAFSGLGEEFIILAESAVTVEPAKCALDDPAFGQDLEAFGRVATPDNFEFPTGELFDPSLQLSGVAAVGPDLFQSRTVEANLLDQSARPVTVLNAGRVHDHADGQSQGIDDKVALASFNLLASVVAALRPPFSPVLTDWLSMIAAVGFAWRCFNSRTRSWSLS